MSNLKSERRIREQFENRLERMQAEYESRLESSIEVIENQQKLINKLRKENEALVTILKRIITNDIWL